MPWFTPTNEELRKELPIIPDIVNIVSEYLGTPFIIVVSGKTINIPLFGSHDGFNIDWGDTQYTNVPRTPITPYVEHIYADNLDSNNNDVSSDKHIIQIHGKINNTFFRYAKYLLEITQWSDMVIRHGARMFEKCENLKISARDQPNLKFAVDLSHMFYGCSKLAGNLNNWDVSTIKNMKYMFSTCEEININISRWNTSSVTDMTGMFSQSKTFTSNLSRWNVGNVIYMDNMFSYCVHFTSDLSIWNVGHVTHMSYLFMNCHNFESDLSRWNVSNVIYMSHIFSGCLLFNSDLSNWDVRNVILLHSAFEGCKNFKSDLRLWNLRNVSHMEDIFKGTRLSTRMFRK
jgi:surface protein